MASTWNGSGCGLGLLGFQLEPEGLWHGGGWRAGQAKGHFHGIVDEPLQGSQGSDHDDTREQALP